MANYQLLKADIDEKVYQNGAQEITGANLNSVLNQMVTTLGTGYQFAGVATIATNPGTPDAKVFYIANGKGTYEKFGGLEVTEDDVVVLYWDSSWHKQATGIASQAKLTELESETKYINLTDIPLKNAFFNGFDLKVGDIYAPDEGTYSNEVSCVRIDVQEGEVYRLKGKCNTYAYKGWWIVNANNVVTRIIEDVDSYDTELTIQAEESKLYVNCLNYDSATDKVQKVEIIPVKEEVKQLKEEGKQLKEDNTESISLNTRIVAGYAYNLGFLQVGQVYTDAPNASATSAYAKYYVDENSKYVIKGVGSPNAYRLYAFFDRNMKCLEVASGDYNTRNFPLVLTPPKDAKAIIVNYTNYDSALDSLTQETTYSVLSPKQQPLKGKTIVCFGDSITQFMDVISMRYSDYIELSGANVVNVGIGGTQIRRRTASSASPTSSDQAWAGLDIISLIEAVANKNYDIPKASVMYLKNDLEAVITRLENIDWNGVDIVTFFAGTNDWLNGNNLGDVSNEDADTTLGAMNLIVKLLLTTYPHLKIYWFTPIVRYVASSIADRTDANWGGTKMNSEGKTLLDYVNAIKIVAENNCIPVCDMYRTMGWYKYNFSQYFNDDDGTHPYKGFKEIADRMQSFILSNL